LQNFHSLEYENEKKKERKTAKKPLEICPDSASDYTNLRGGCIAYIPRLFVLKNGGKKKKEKGKKGEGKK
jgi:hypothetical protein